MVIKKKKKERKKTLLPAACLSLSLQILDENLAPPASESEVVPCRLLLQCQRREGMVGSAVKKNKEITSTVCNLRSVGVNIPHTGCGQRGETDALLQGMRRDVFFPNGYRVNANIFPLGLHFQVSATDTQLNSCSSTL